MRFVTRRCDLVGALLIDPICPVQISKLFSLAGPIPKLKATPLDDSLNLA